MSKYDRGAKKRISRSGPTAEEQAKACAKELSVVRGLLASVQSRLLVLMQGWGDFRVNEEQWRGQMELGTVLWAERIRLLVIEDHLLTLTNEVRAAGGMEPTEGGTEFKARLKQTLQMRIDADQMLKGDTSSTANSYEKYQEDCRLKPLGFQGLAN